MAFITFVGLGNRLTGECLRRHHVRLPVRSRQPKRSSPPSPFNRVPLPPPPAASVAFPSLALFNLLRFPVMMLPMIINQVINAKVSGARLQKFFDSEEAQPIRGLPGPSAISCQGATFQWTTPPPAQKDGAPKGPFGGPPGGPMGKGKGKKEKKGKGKEGPGANGGGPGGPGANGGGDRAPEVVEGFKLGPIDLEIPKGKLVMVVGEVGSGKTSLLMGLLKEMAHKSGEVSMSGSIAYTSQDPWIQNATLERNVLVSDYATLVAGRCDNMQRGAMRRRGTCRAADGRADG